MNLGKLSNTTNRCKLKALKLTKRVFACSSASRESSAYDDGAVVYNSSTGPSHKVTIEHVYGPLMNDQQEADHSRLQDTTSTSTSQQAGPWKMSWQMSERNMTWSNDLKIRLIKQVASEKLGLSVHEMDIRLSQLFNILPGLEPRLAAAPPDLVARLASQTTEVAVRVLRLKDIFPTANITAMLSNRLSLLLEDDIALIEETSQKLRARLPAFDVDRFVQDYPVVLDYDAFETAMQDAQRLMPTMDATELLRRDPDVILSLLKGKHMIPYDQVPNPWS
ncbi:hypothetical protein CEUSTIGMA_g665.t1 [Chlamydomonas eustigma]|uniref:Uncharacterized protein n=1 Tax=Chlamydomonas eustigma TaxID=1157962 RepID=A0A250WRB6_9CHLO|nr:hypothetical protein CEUSTIGMA_g665.t1 [Chlamydomonas eustigma]|eukprot:GAX73212.1 hypothetical protein CEUSTIGMA_g665.t1 [Chlamydomonas eustigma]